MEEISSNSASSTKDIPAYVRQRDLIRLLPFSAATLWRKVKSGQFVPPVKLSQRITAWKRADVIAWLEAQEAVQ